MTGKHGKTATGSSAIRRREGRRAQSPAKASINFARDVTEAVNAYLSGDEATGKAVLRDVVNATIGFEQLATELGKPSKSLHRMLGPGGNPSTANFFAILRVLQKRAGVKLTVKAA